MNVALDPFVTTPLSNVSRAANSASEPNGLLEYASTRIAAPELALYPNPPEFAAEPLSKSATVNVALSGHALGFQPAARTANMSGRTFQVNGTTITGGDVAVPGTRRRVRQGSTPVTPKSRGTGEGLERA